MPANWPCNSWLRTGCTVGRSVSIVESGRWGCASIIAGPSSFQSIWSSGTIPGTKFEIQSYMKSPMPWLALVTAMTEFGSGSASRLVRGRCGADRPTCRKAGGRPDAAGVGRRFTGTGSRSEAEDGSARVAGRTGEGWCGKQREVRCHGPQRHNAYWGNGPVRNLVSGTRDGLFPNLSFLTEIHAWTRSSSQGRATRRRDGHARPQTLDDLNGLMRTMMKSALERMLNTEMDVHLGRKTIAASPPTPATPTPTRRRPPPPKNRRNGHSQKTVSGDMGELTLDTPRDRNGTFEPQLIAKHQRRLAGFDEKILALYAKGMTTRDIQDVVKELYGVEVSPTLVSEITADLDAEVTAWRTAAARCGLADRLPRRHRGARARRERPGVAAHDVRRHRRESAGKKGASGPVAERDRRAPSSGCRA